MANLFITILVLFALVAASSASRAQPVPELTVWSATHDFYEVGFENVTVMLTMDSVTGVETPLWNLTLQTALASAYDYDTGMFYLADENFDIWKIDVVKQTEDLLISGLPTDMQVICVVDYWIAFDSTSNSIYGWVSDTWGNSSIFQITVLSYPPKLTELAKNIDGDELADAQLLSVGFPIDNNHNFFAVWGLAGPEFKVSTFNLESKKLQISTVTEDYYNCNTILWDSKRGRLTAFFIDTNNTLSYAEIKPPSFEVNYLLKYNSTYSLINNYAYDPKSDVLFLKLEEGDWHNRWRNYTYAAIDPMTGNMVSSVKAYKEKGEDGIWHYTGPKLGDYIAFFSV